MNNTLFKMLSELHGDIFMQNVSNYPPVDIITDENDAYILRFALAGFLKENIQVQQHENCLLS